MRDKIKIIFDILFNNGQYMKATKDLYVKDNLYIKETICHPITIFGRYIHKGKILPNDEVCYKLAIKELLNSELLNSMIKKSFFVIEDMDSLRDNEIKIAYNVELKIINK